MMHAGKDEVKYAYHIQVLVFKRSPLPCIEHSWSEPNYDAAVPMVDLVVERYVLCRVGRHGIDPVREFDLCRRTLDRPGCQSATSADIPKTIQVAWLLHAALTWSHEGIWHSVHTGCS